MTQIQSLRLRPYRYAFRHALETAHGVVTERQGWHVIATDTQGRRGLGDIAPWPGFGSAPEEFKQALEGLGRDSLRGLRVDFVEDLDLLGDWPSEIIYGLEGALLDLLGQETGQSVFELLGGRPQVLRSHTLIGAPEQAERVVPGQVCKVKIGQDSAEAEWQRLEGLRQCLPSDVVLRLDVNGAWSVDEARRFLQFFEGAEWRPEFIEQPVAKLADVGLLQSETEIVLMADEALRSAQDFEDFFAQDQVRGLVLKPMFCGGLRACLKWARLAQERGMTVTVTHALESAVGLQFLRHGLMALEQPPVCALNSSLAEDYCHLSTGNELTVARKPGLGLPESKPAASLTLPDMIASYARSRPDHAFLRIGTQSFTAKDIQRRVSVVAGALKSQGLSVGQRVLLFGPRTDNWLVHFFAVLRLGAVVAPMVEPSESRALWLKLARLAGAHRGLCLTEGGIPDFAEWPRDFWLSSECQGSEAVTDADLVFEAPVMQIASSGSTGGCEWHSLTLSQCFFGAMGSMIRLGHAVEDRWLQCLPFEHVGGLAILLRCAWAQSGLQLLPKIDLESVAGALSSGAVTQVSLVPTMLERLIERHDSEGWAWHPALRFALIGGGALSPRLRQRCQELGLPVALTWGLTESAAQVATGFVGELSEGVGPALAFARVDAVDGQLRIAGPQVRGSLQTQDLGCVDSDGRVQWLGRADSIMKSGGKKISGAEIEAVLAAHPRVTEAAAVAVDDEQWGQRPWAFVELSCDWPGHEAELKAWCQRQLPRFHSPDRIVVLEKLPRTGLHKLSRRALLDKARELLRSVDAHDERTHHV